MARMLHYDFVYRCAGKIPAHGTALIARSADPAHADSLNWRIAHVTLENGKQLTPEKRAKIDLFLHEEKRRDIELALIEEERR